jgi:acetyl/propionyl-CoA carboxylase alpha subunit
VLGEVAWPEAEGLRVDTWVRAGSLVSHNFDSLIAKIMMHADGRDACIDKMLAALAGAPAVGLCSKHCCVSSRVM